VTGVVVQVGKDSVVIDIGGKSEGVIPKEEFVTRRPALGQARRPRGRLHSKAARATTV